jgi:hypothetical protein
MSSRIVLTIYPQKDVKCCRRRAGLGSTHMTTIRRAGGRPAVRPRTAAVDGHKRANGTRVNEHVPSLGGYSRRLQELAGSVDLPNPLSGSSGNQSSHFAVSRRLPSMVTGEGLHAIGADGADAARRWLNSTTRAKVFWVRPDPIADDRLTFYTPNNLPFSFDIGGLLQGGETHGLEFLAEVKNYSHPSDQGTEFKKFLAKCYRTYRVRPERCGSFYWITWTPFSANSWHQLNNPESVNHAVCEQWKYNFGNEEEAAGAELDADAVDTVSGRVWKLVLSDYQVANLTMTDEHRSIIVQHEVAKGRE